jgi:hypothetical protein
MSIKHPINSVINWNYFCLNFRHDFIEQCWKGMPRNIDHFKQKFSDIYDRKGTALMPFFFSELDRYNQEKLINWVNENYISFPDLITEAQ